MDRWFFSFWFRLRTHTGASSPISNSELVVRRWQFGIISSVRVLMELIMPLRDKQALGKFQAAGAIVKAMGAAINPLGNGEQIVAIGQLIQVARRPEPA